MSKRITIKAVEALEPGKTIWDDKVTGFGARRQKQGVSYIVKTRLNGRQKLITIGRHGAPWTPETARQKALRILADIAEGHDPNEVKRKMRARQPLEVIWREFEQDHVSRLKKSSQDEYCRLYRVRIKPALGRKPLADITQTDISSFHKKLKDVPRTANHCLAIISKLMNWAQARGMLPPNANPVKGITRYPERPRERYLNEEELARLDQALEEELEERGNIYSVAAIRLLLFTGARRGEILTLKWKHVWLDDNLILLPDSKSGKRGIILNTPARKVLETLPRISGNPYVICGQKEGRHLVNVQKPWGRIRKRAGLEDVHLHDLRHTFASMAARQGGSLLKIGTLLGQTQSQTTQRYAHLIPGDMKDLNEDVGRGLEKAMGHADG